LASVEVADLTSWYVMTDEVLQDFKESQNIITSTANFSVLFLIFLMNNSFSVIAIFFVLIIAFNHYRIVALV